MVLKNGVQAIWYLYEKEQENSTYTETNDTGLKNNNFDRFGPTGNLEEFNYIAVKVSLSDKGDAFTWKFSLLSKYEIYYI
ncbi:hypothetical protein CON22_26040 [Bacillus cereus]|nr:hypothetical protein CON22_26040 [Bacillus cereus]